MVILRGDEVAALCELSRVALGIIVASRCVRRSFTAAANMITALLAQPSANQRAANAHAMRTVFRVLIHSDDIGMVVDKLPSRRT